MDLYVAVSDGVAREQAVPLPVGTRLVLGRGTNADVVLETPSVNGRHCEVGRDEERVWARNLDERGGTFLNGRRLRTTLLGPQVTLRPGDRLRMAGVVAALVRADPVWLAWNDGGLRNMAQVISDKKSFGSLPLLADALEEAGCTDEMILSHCRGGVIHAEGCWVTDLLIGATT